MYMISQRSTFILKFPYEQRMSLKELRDNFKRFPHRETFYVIYRQMTKRYSLCLTLFKRESSGRQITDLRRAEVLNSTGIKE